MDIQQVINAKQGEILTHKAYLNATDYKVIRSTETGMPINSETLQQRAEARNEINRLEEEINDLQSQINNENTLFDDENNL